MFPKEPEGRNPHLLAMARGMPCLLRIPEVCNNDSDTVVAAHSNISAHGKALGRKASDAYTVWACSSCHAWLDQGPASKQEKIEAFEKAHKMQFSAWEEIATDSRESDRDRKSAQWAVDELL